MANNVSISDQGIKGGYDMITKDDIIRDFRELAIQLKRTPKRKEFVKHSKTRYAYTHFYKWYTNLVQEAGCPINRKVRARQFKITDQELKDALRKALHEHPNYESVYALIEAHCPYSFASYSKRFGGSDAVKLLAKDLSSESVYRKRYPVTYKARSVYCRWIQTGRIGNA